MFYVKFYKGAMDMLQNNITTFVFSKNSASMQGI